MRAPEAVRRPPAMDPRIRRRRVAVTRARGRRRLRALLSVAAVVSLGAGALAVLHSPLLSARHLSVVGSGHTPAATVERRAGLAGHPPLVDLDTTTAALRVQALPWVARASVVRRWPDSVVVRVVERVPVAVVASRRGGKVLVDAGGRVLGPAGASTALPTLTGAGVAGPAGSTMGRRALAGLAVASVAGRAMGGQVRAVGVQGADVTLDLGGGVRALLGPPRQLDAKLTSLRSVLVGAPPKGPQTIDVTVPAEPTVGPGSP
ncbi:MAG: FtsQ-type POTRA domain-containing protein [Acidobacteriota bacterium]|nr:FtsQ-type POTRA domain-containing protein [Acidobacteriota bacterium]